MLTVPIQQIANSGAWNVVHRTLHTPQRVMAIAVVVFDEGNRRYGHTANADDVQAAEKDRERVLQQKLAEARSEEHRRAILDDASRATRQDLMRDADEHATKRITHQFTSTLIKNMRALGELHRCSSVGYCSYCGS